MERKFFSQFLTPDSRWRTRHTSRGNEADRCIEYDTANGNLRMQVKGDPTRDFVVPHISTEETFVFTHGVAKCRMRFNGPWGFHSCFWLAPVGGYIPGQAEIDINEHFGGMYIKHNVYWRLPGQNIGEYEKVQLKTANFNPFTWNTYELEWSPDFYKFRINGELKKTITEGLSDMPKFLVLSILPNNDSPPTTYDKFSADVDWVEVLQ